MHACNVLSIVHRQFYHELEVEREGIVGGREVLLGDMDKLWKLVAFMIAVIAPRSGGGENTMFWNAHGTHPADKVQLHAKTRIAQLDIARPTQKTEIRHKYTLDHLV